MPLLSGGVGILQRVMLSAAVGRDHQAKAHNHQGTHSNINNRIINMERERAGLEN